LPIVTEIIVEMAINGKYEDKLFVWEYKRHSDNFKKGEKSSGGWEMTIIWIDFKSPRIEYRRWRNRQNSL